MKKCGSLLAYVLSPLIVWASLDHLFVSCWFLVFEFEYCAIEQGFVYPRANDTSLSN